MLFVLGFLFVVVFWGVLGGWLGGGFGGFVLFDPFIYLFCLVVCVFCVGFVCVCVIVCWFLGGWG